MADSLKDPASLLALCEGSLVDDDPKLVLEAAEKALALSEAAKDATGAVHAKRFIVLAKAASGEVDAGLAQAKEELEKCKSAKQKHGEGVMLLALAEAQIFNKEPEEAQASAKGASEAFEADKDGKAWKAKAKVASANISLMLDKMKEAQAAAEEAKQLCKDCSDKKGEAAALEQLAVVMVMKNRNKEALESLEEAATIYKSLGCKREEANALNSVAETYLKQQKGKAAVGTSGEALQVAKEAEYTAGIRRAMGLKAQALALTGSLAAAEDTFRAEACAAKKAGDLVGEALAFEALFQARLAAQDPERALHTARKAMGALLKAKDFKGAARIMHSIAILEYERNYWDVSLRMAQEALGVLEDAGGSLKVKAELTTLMAWAHEALGEEPSNSALRIKALKVLQELGTALEEQNVEAFQGALDRLGWQSGFTDQDTDRIITEAKKKNPSAAQDFLDQHMPDWQPATATQQEETLEVPPQYSLRSFPVSWKQEQWQWGSTVDLVEFTQTKGSIILYYTMGDEPNQFRTSELVVKMSKRKLEVIVNDTPLKPLTGELTELIWVRKSWWKLEEETNVLELHLYKRQQLIWKSPWLSYNNTIGAGAFKFRRTPFPWRKEQEQNGAETNNARGIGLYPDWNTRVRLEDPNAEANLEVKPHGMPMDEQDEGASFPHSSYGEVFQVKSDLFICSADEVVLGLMEEQPNTGPFGDDKCIVLGVCFDYWKFQDLQNHYPLERLLGVDVWDSRICVFLQGDKQNPILWGDLYGRITPELTTWSLESSDNMVMKQRQQSLGSPTTMLKIKLVRAHPEEKWPKVFEQCIQHPLMPKDAYATSKDTERFEGLEDASDLRRSGFDLESSDFWSYVEDYVNDTMKRRGFTSMPRKLVLT